MKYCIICRDNEKSAIIKNKIKEAVTLEYCEINPDIVIAIGGDGTILKAAHQYTDAVIFGVNTGNLGFHANYKVDDVDLLVNDINTNSFSVDKLELITAEFIDDKGNVICDNAVNEVTIVSPVKVLLLNVFIDDEYFESFRGTGLCISTPYGSTAYNKSLHGAIIDPSLNVIQLTEMAGINSNAYRTITEPLVLSSSRVIDLKSDYPIDLSITLDYISYEVKGFKRLTIRNSSNCIKMGYHKYEGFINRIRRTFLD